MRVSIGGLSLINIFIVFFIIVAFLLTGTVMYYKGYKVNSKIIESLEKYEGYNEHSAADINRVLTSLGYRRTSGKECIHSSNGENLCDNDNMQFDFKLSCSYDNKSGSGVNSSYIKYKVTTYIFIDLPLGVGTVKLPVTTRTNPIYQFTGYENGLGCE